MSKNKKSKSTVCPDRISDLPEAIIHQILSLLPAIDATRTSDLSKTFYSSWNSFPVIDLDAAILRCSSMEFVDLVNRTIQRRSLVKQVSINFYAKVETKQFFFLPRTIVRMSSITKLTLSQVSLDFNLLALHLPLLESLSLTSCSGFKHFDYFFSKKIRSIRLDMCPGLESIVIESSSIETFELDCHPQTPCTIIDISECKSLKNLVLCLAEINDLWIRNNLPNLAHLEDLQLIDCYWLNNLRIVNDNLKSLIVRAEDGLMLSSMQIAAKNLQSLFLDVLEASNIRMINSFMHLRDITLYIFCPGESVMEFLKESVSKFIRLETLNVRSVNWDFSGIEINNQHLKTLVFSFDSISDADFVEQELGEVTLNTPNLVSLKYRGCAKPFRVLSSMDLLNAKLKLDISCDTNSDGFFVKWLNLIQTFSNSKVLKLSCFSQEELIFPKELRRHQLVAPINNCEHVELKLRKGEISTELVDSLLWLWPSLQTLCFFSKKKSIKILCEPSTSEEETFHEEG